MKDIQTSQQQQTSLDTPSLIQRGTLWLTPKLKHGWERVQWLLQQMKPGKRNKAKPQQRKRAGRTWVDGVIDGAFLIVTSLAFLVFLVASLPHVAYFVVTFEPQNPDGSISDWWWAVAYLIAGAIHITEFLLSIKFARDVRNATRGLPWYQKFLPTCATIFKYWPFIIFISGFSWAANLEHAEQFHSFMLSTAESVKVVLPFDLLKDKTWGDLNPYIVSAYPLLNIAYTFMFDSSRDDDLQAGESESEESRDLQTLSESKNSQGLQNLSESQHSADLNPVSESDFVLLLQTMQAMNERHLQAMQEMQREGLKVTVETLHHLAGGKAKQKPARLPSGEKQSTVSAARKGSAYEEPIKALFLKNPRITAVEAGQRVGCSHVTAAAILKALRPVKVTQVDPSESVTESETVEGESA